MRLWVKYSSQVRKTVPVEEGDMSTLVTVLVNAVLGSRSQAGDAEDTGLEKWLSRRTLTTLPEASVLYPRLDKVAHNHLYGTPYIQPGAYNGPLLTSTGTDMCRESTTHLKQTVVNRGQIIRRIFNIV